MKSLIFLAMIASLVCPSLYAEVTLDGTLGPRIALDGSDYQIRAKLGQRYGGNLFHSFHDFNLNRNEIATFSGPDSVNNIISRVTGGNPSNIDGVIRSTISNADMYFLNPFGIMFGPNASLDIHGSFHASTADTLRFQNGGEFNARFPQESLLTVAPISAFGFLTDSPQPLSIENSELITNNHTLSVIGGAIQINNATLVTDPGRINIASVASQGDVTLLEDDLTLSAQPGNITLQDSTVFATSGENSGIYIRAGQFFLENTKVQAYNTSNVAEINVQANSLRVTNGGQFINEAYSSGQGGNIKIKVTGVTEFSGESIRSDGTIDNSGISVIALQDGNGGNIELETGTLNLKDGAYITASTFQQGQGGNINIHATDAITMQNSSIHANTLSEMENAGHGGTVTIKAYQLYLQDGAQLKTSTAGIGQGGNIKIQVNDLIRLKGVDSAGYGSFIGSNANGLMNDAGDAGSIELQAKRLQLADGAQINTTTTGPGQGGKLAIKVAKEAAFSGLDHSEEGYASGIASSSNSEADNAGDAGIIVLKVGNLCLADEAEINATTWGSGQGGDIAIQAKKINLSGKSLITVHSDAKGDAGQISLTTEGKIVITGGSRVETSAEHADGGNLVITTPSYVYLNNGEITTSVSEEFGSGGNVNASPQFVVLDNSQIFAKAKKGKGGNINVTTTGIYNFTGEPIEEIINASSEFGVDGIVVVNSPDTDVSGQLLVLPKEFIDISAQLQSPCNSRMAENPSSFTITNSEGTPNSPDDLLPSGPQIKR